MSPSFVLRLDVKMGVRWRVQQEKEGKREKQAKEEGEEGPG